MHTRTQYPDSDTTALHLQLAILVADTQPHRKYEGLGMSMKHDSFVPHSPRADASQSAQFVLQQDRAGCSALLVVVYEAPVGNSDLLERRPC